MKNQLKLSSVLSVLPQQVTEGLVADLKAVGLSAEEAVVKRAGVADDAFTLAEGERAITQYVSTRDVDRSGEVVMPQGIDLRHYLKNPVVLWGHDYSQPPIGSDAAIAADDYGLKAKTVYASTPRAQEVWTLRKEGHLRTSSIGFVPTEMVRSNDSGFLKMMDECRAKWPEFKKVADQCRAFIRKCILLEHSDVSIPCNPNALTLAVAKSLNLSDEMVKALGIVEGNDVAQISRELMAELMGVDVTKATNAAFMQWLKERKDYVPKATEPAPVIRLVSEPPIMREVPVIRVDHAATQKEMLKNLLDLHRGKV